MFFLLCFLGQKGVDIDDPAVEWVFVVVGDIVENKVVGVDCVCGPHEKEKQFFFGFQMVCRWFFRWFSDGFFFKP